METKTTINHQTPLFGKQMLEDAVCRPILFSTPMVQAIIAGQKTMTRRILKVKGCKPFIPDNTWDIDSISKWNKDFNPYGKVGDILWVRETFSNGNIENKKHTGFRYKADDESFNVKWKPSLFMPKDACRLFLEIIDVKIERLKDISANDIKSEGVSYTIDYYPNLLELWEDLWVKINGQQSWDDNPFVWAIRFKVVECPYGFC